jgi:hypothetical protein
VSQPTRATVTGRVYRDLQNLARRDRRPFEELLTLYTLEGFLIRLAGSAHSATLVLKGGAAAGRLRYAPPDQRRGLRGATADQPGGRDHDAGSRYRGDQG